MDATEFLVELASAGVNVKADGDQLVIWPASILTDEMRRGVVALKPEILALLVVGACSRCAIAATSCWHAQRSAA